MRVNVTCPLELRNKGMISLWKSEVSHKTSEVRPENSPLKSVQYARLLIDGINILKNKRCQLEYGLNCSGDAGRPNQESCLCSSPEAAKWEAGFSSVRTQSDSQLTLALTPCLASLLAFHDMGLQREGWVVSNIVLVYISPSCKSHFEGY